ncbi:MAG: group 1 truncated hemoglobin [Gemmatimonadetes bacterium]|nr:group 1 truncated hemoglobin [Gemmatimonadota bacterium]
MHRKSAVLTLALAALAFAGCPKTEQQTSRPAAADTSATLYRRLGGYDAIAAVTDDFLARMLGDSRMAPYFESLDDAGKKRVRQMIVDQLCAATGGPCFYVGADMVTAHKGLNISETAFGVAAQYLTATLDKFQVPQKEKDEVLAIVGSTQSDIVGK